jgi:ABC-2 type transport system ATP-binding protein
MVTARNLRKQYGEALAVADVSFTIQSGERVGLLGLNGAGKSTTLRLLMGVHAPSSGSVEVDGRDVTREPEEVKRRIGYLPETAPLYRDLTPLEQLTFFARLRQLPSPQSEAAHALEQAGVATRESRRPISELSKGFRQRVGLAQALLGAPPVLILDEPTDGLDPAQRVETRRLIRSLGERHTILLSTHVLPEAQEICSRVLILHEGRIALDLPAQSAELEARFLEVTRQ